MKRTRFSEEQIIGVLHEAGGGVSIREVCRKHGITSRHSSAGERSTAGSRSAKRDDSRVSRMKTAD